MPNPGERRLLLMSRLFLRLGDDDVVLPGEQCMFRFGPSLALSADELKVERKKLLQSVVMARDRLGNDVSMAKLLTHYAASTDPFIRTRPTLMPKTWRDMWRRLNGVWPP
eukprot:TRINITY_DN7580_c0_g1_i1.p1 TRINITY_DN7580_c0_g1~~TRINITY_DN7580_c0_g1_i1.p1  ORF type:complete len:110 (+),score=5.55 TRINITY_DN7580_c0_g1_i1:1141-1470(+)